MARKKSTTKQAMDELARLGFDAGPVEQTIPHTFIKRDYIGIIDVIAFKPGVGVVGIQVTSASNHAARRTKAQAEPRLRRWLESGGRFELWSFRDDGSLRREELKAKDVVME